MRKLSHQEIVERQSRRGAEPKIPVHVVLNNIRSLYNVGSIFRTADGAGVEKIWICGITGSPPHAQIAKTALGAQECVPWEYEKDAARVLRGLKKKGFQVVLLEQTKESVPYHVFEPQSPVCLVIGNEITGIAENILDLCDAALEIHMAGIKNSLNVSVAFGIMIYHLRSMMMPKT